MRFWVEPKSSKTTLTPDEIMWNWGRRIMTYADSDLAAKYGISSSELKTIEKYNWSWYERINQDLRNWFVNKDANDLSRVLQKLPTVEWQTIRWINLNNDLYNELYWWVEVWDIITEKWFTSTSADWNHAAKFAWYFWDDQHSKSVIMIINWKNWRFTLNSKEKEVLFDKWTKFRVTKKKERWPLVNLYLDEL